MVPKQPRSPPWHRTNRPAPFPPPLAAHPRLQRAVLRLCAAHAERGRQRVGPHDANAALQHLLHAGGRARQEAGDQMRTQEKMFLGLTGRGWGAPGEACLLGRAGRWRVSQGGGTAPLWHSSITSEAVCCTRGCTQALSLHCGAHFAQWSRDPHFRLYDYGSKAANRQHYGTDVPPSISGVAVACL